MTFSPDTFISRPNEQHEFDEMLGFKDERRLLALHAEAGHGKSALLQKFKQDCQSAKIPVSLIAFDQLDVPNPVILLERLARDLKSFVSFSNFERANNARLGRNFGMVSALARSSSAKPLKSGDVPLQLVGGAAVPSSGRFHIPEAVSELAIRGLTNEEEALALEVCISAFDEELDRHLKRARQPVVLLFDALEHCPAGLREWLLNHFLKLHVFTPGKNKRLAVVAAGRELPAWPKDAVKALTLSAWTLDDIRDCLKAHHADESLAARLQGKNVAPLYIVQFAQVAAKFPDTPLASVFVSSAEDFGRLLWEAMLEAERLRDAQFADVLAACAIPRRIDAQIIGAIREAPDDPEGNTDLLKALAAYRFVIARQDEGYVYHESIRERLLDEWRAKPEFEAAAKRIADAFMHRWAADLTAKRYSEALADIGYGLELQPEASFFHDLRGLTYALMGAYEVALGDYSRAVQLTPEDASAIRNRGLTYAQLERHQEALESFTRALELEPDAETYANRGTCYAKMRKLDEALADFARAIQLDPTISDAYNSRGYVYYQLEKWKEAEADYRRTIELRPDYAAPHNNIGLVLYAQERYAEALEWYNKAIKLQPNYVNALVNRGISLYHLGRFKEAIADYNRAVSLDGSQSSIFYHRGLAYDAMERYKEALADYSRALEINPRNADALFHRGHIYHGMGQWQQALADYNRFIEVKPDYSGAWFARAGVYFAIERFKESIEDYNHAIQLEPKAAPIYLSRGMSLTFLQRYEEALNDFNRALELDPQATDAYHQRATVFGHLGRYEEALADFTRAIEAKPDEDEIYFNRGNMYSSMERYPEALADFDHALKLNPRNTDALIGKGLVLTYTGQYAEAQKVYKRVYDINPKDFTNLYNLAAVTVRAKGFEGAKKEVFNARKALEKLLNGMYHGRGLYGLGGLSALEGDTNAALDYLKRAMTYERQAKLWASKDIAWLDLRDDHRFKALVKE